MKYLLILLTLISNLSFSQNTPNQLMQKAKKTFYSHKNIKIDFSFYVEVKNRGEIGKREQKGKIIFSKDKYHAYIGDFEQIYDGEKIYTIMNEDQEVNINSPKESKFITPNKIFNSYNKTYTLKKDILQKTPKGKIRYIKLIPKKKDKKINYLLVGINTKDYSIHKIIEVNHKGSSSTLDIRETSTNQKLNNNIFSFDSNKYENELGYIINNMVF